MLGFGFSVLAIAMTRLSFEMSTTTPTWLLVVSIVAIGVGMAAFMSSRTAIGLPSPYEDTYSSAAQHNTGSGVHLPEMLRARLPAARPWPWMSLEAYAEELIVARRRSPTDDLISEPISELSGPTTLPVGFDLVN